MKPETMSKIIEHVEHARNKHQVWPKNRDYALEIAEMEWGEVRHAVRWETVERMNEELYDHIAVCVRMIEGDWL